MFAPYISTKEFAHNIDCFCPDTTHEMVMTINKGDIIEVLGERTFTMTNGWYFLVKVNNQEMFYMAIEDLEYYVMKERLISLLDLALKMNYSQFKINQSLEVGDKSLFMTSTNNLKELSNLKLKMEEYVSQVAVF